MPFRYPSYILPHVQESRDKHWSLNHFSRSIAIVATCSYGSFSSAAAQFEESFVGAAANAALADYLRFAGAVAETERVDLYASRCQLTFWDELCKAQVCDQFREREMRRQSIWGAP